MQLNEAQKSAVEYLNGPLLVLAGPGTGKTQLLSSRVAYILKNTDTNPENILCITFTENGAANMRERLNSIIGKDSRKINIHTYHAFGSDILASYKNYAENFERNLDSPIDEISQFKIINKIIEELPALDILKNSKINDIRDTIKSAKDARLTADDLEKIASVNIDESAEISSAISSFFEELIPRMKYDLALEKVYLPIAEYLGHSNHNHPILKNIDHITRSLALDLAEAIEAAVNEKKLKPLSKWKEDYFEKDDSGNYRLKDKIANKKLLSFASVMRKYDDYLKKEGLFDFSDMIEETISILKSDEGFRLTLAEKFQYILLDEFQDTNPSQFELIKLLTKSSKNPDIMAVGDDDQAIFEFQGANASNLSNFKNYYSAHVINLTENYRSTPEILNFSRQIADQIPDSFAKKHGVEKNLRAMKSLPKNSHLEISRHEFLAADAEYYWVANEIHRLIKSGIPQKSIAIITPKHKYIAPLLPYLKSFKNINISYEKKDNLLEDRKLHEILSLARFVYDLANQKTPSINLLEILSFPFLKISPTDALETISLARSEKRTILNYLTNSENPEIKKLAEFLATLALRSFDTPLELFIDYLTGSVPLNLENGEEYRSNFIEFYAKNLSDYSTFELYENLSVLKEKIKNHTKSQNPKLSDLISFLEDYELANAPLINTSPYQDSSDSIQILTAHASKGLEFEYVFLVATDNMSWGKGKGNNNFLVLPKNLVQIRHTGTTDSERLRLFFVAITRAKSNLIITNSIKDFSGKSPDRLDYLSEFVDENKDLISPYLPENSKKVILHYEDFDESQKISGLRSSWISSYLVLTPNLESILRKRLERYTLTASDLTSFVDIIYSGPLEFYKNKILRAPSEPLNFQIVFGNLIHSTFENVTKKQISDEQAIEFFREKALETPLEKKELDELLERGPTYLEIALKTFGEILRAENSRAEIDLHHEHIAINNIPLTGKIDHISINEKEKTIELYDFKTSKYNPKKWDSDATLLKYSFQLGFYKLLLNNSPTYNKYKVDHGHILFVKPDEENKVYDKVLEFTPTFMDNLQKLISSVYAHIKTLNFLKDEKLSIEPNKNLSLKDLKNFIELVLAKTPKL